MLELYRRIVCFFRRRALERELAEEMRHHLALKAEEGGANAIRAFGNVTLLQEESRAMWSFAIFEQIGQDIRYAFRTMAASPLFTAAAMLSLALGIGANTAIYSFMDAILMRALPAPHAEELVVLKWRTESRASVAHRIMGTSYRDAKNGRISPNFPAAAWDALSGDRNILQSLFAYTTHGGFNLVVNGQAEAVPGIYVSGNFYSGLGLLPAAGRLIGPDDDQAGAVPTVVLGHDYWQRRFASNPAAVGQTILINDTPVVIAGVSAPGFFGVDAAEHEDIAVPLRLRPRLTDRPAAGEQRLWIDRNTYWLELMGRMQPGVTIAQAQTAISGRFRQFALSTATSEKEKTTLPELFLESGASGLDSLRRQYSKPLFVLMAMVGLILSIACANVANLLLARSAARRREMAVRLSLGASRWRIVRQLLTESVMLSLAGGALGVLMAFWGIRFITWVIANGRDNFTLNAELNWPVLGFTLALAVAAGIVFGLAPALQSTKVDLTPALKEGKGGAGRTGRRFPLQPSLSQLLVMAQIAMSLTLVIGAGLFVATISNLHAVDLGFNRQHLLLFALNAKQAGYKDSALAHFYDGIVERVRNLPGARGAGMSQFPLVAQYVNSANVTVPGATAPAKPQEPYILRVDAGFLPTMEIPLLRGRTLDARDMLAPNVAVVNEKFVSTYLEGQTPIGVHFLIGDPKLGRDFEIAGVTKSSRFNSIQEDIESTVYIPYTRDLGDTSRMFFEVRTGGDPLALVSAVRGIVHAANAAVSVTDVNTQERQIEQTIGQQRTFADLCSLFAVLALAIACVGLYGAMAYAVARRTRELGIRMALGAKRGAIVWMVLREALALAVAGLAIGLIAAHEASQLIASFLFGLKPNDASAIAISVSILLAASLAASLAPAWRASRTDPMLAIRHE